MASRKDALLVVFLAAVLCELAAAESSSWIVAVANRDLEGSVILSGDSNYAQNAAACAAQCRNTSGCNIWVFCGASQGCTTTINSYERDLRKYRQCWLKYDNPSSSGFPYWKNKRSDSTGWTSGTIAANVTDSVGRDVIYGDCKCKTTWTQNVDGQTRTFQGVCANPSQQYSPQCDVDLSTCSQQGQQGGLQGCPTPQSCSAYVGVDLEGMVITNGDYNYRSAAEECCAHCTATKGCQIWVWCGDPLGCGMAGIRSYRQCWLKSGDPKNPSAKADSAPGWISGVRLAYV